MYKVVYTTESLRAIDTYIIQYTSYFEQLYSDSVIWSEDQIIEQYRREWYARYDEIIDMITHALQSDVTTTVKKRFADLPSTHSLYAYVNFGVAQGWVNVRNTNFRPDDIVTQGEIDKLIAAIKGTANADTIALKTPSVSRGKAASDIVEAFY